MNFYFFKRNLIRQIILFCSLLLLLLFTWQMVKDHSASGIVVFGAAVTLLLFWIVYQYCSYVRVDENGVTYHAPLKEYCLRWDEIGQAKVIPRWNIQIPWVIVLRSDDPKDLTRKYNAMNRRDECITFPYIKEAADLINRYRRQHEIEAPSMKLNDSPISSPNQDAMITTQDERAANRSRRVPSKIKATVIKQYAFNYAAILLSIWIIWQCIDLLSSSTIQEYYIFIATILLFIVLDIQFIWQLFFGRYSYAVRISSKGIQYKKRKDTYFIAWEDVDKILAMPNRYGIYNKSATICFLRRGADPHIVTSDMKRFGPNFFGVQYRYRVVAVIRQYWSGRIWNIERVCDKSRVFDQ